MSSVKILFTSIILLFSLALSARDYKASLFGIRSDGITLNTRSIQKAIDYVSENGGGRLVFYVGRYLTGTIQLKSNVIIHLEEGAILVGTTSVYDYVPVSGKRALLTAWHQQNLGITGPGVIDGRGAALLEKINDQIRRGYLQESVSRASPALIAMDSCSRVVISQVNLLDACGPVQSFSRTGHVSVSKVTVKSTAVQGSAGMLLSGCDSISVMNSYFDTSGEEIALTLGSKKITITGCRNASGKTLRARP